MRKDAFILIFGLSVLFAYGSDLAPHYIKTFSSGKVRVIGALASFSEPCIEAAREDIECRSSYRISSENFLGLSGKLDVGLGIIINPVEIVCSNDRTKRMYLANPVQTRNVMRFFNRYQTFSLSLIPCTGDLLILNWVKKGSYRFGYSNGPAVVGDPEWVEHVKVAVQFFQDSLPLILTLTFLIFFVSARSYKRVTQRKFAMTPLDGYWLYWIGFNLGAAPLERRCFVKITIT